LFQNSRHIRRGFCFMGTRNMLFCTYMNLTQDDIKKLADMSRIEVTDAEAMQYAQEFSDILGYVSEIQSVDVPFVHDTFDVSNVFRDDVWHDSHFSEVFLREVPVTEGPYVKVKQIL